MGNEEEKEVKFALFSVKLLTSPLDGFKDGSQWGNLDHQAVFYELDNYSDQIAFYYGQQLAQRSEQNILLVQVKDGQETGRITDFINRFIKLRAKTHSILIGEHPLLQKLLKKVGAQGFLHTNDEEEAYQRLVSITSS